MGGENIGKIVKEGEGVLLRIEIEEIKEKIGKCEREEIEKMERVNLRKVELELRKIGERIIVGKREKEKRGKVIIIKIIEEGGKERIEEIFMWENVRGEMDELWGKIDVLKKE